VVKPVGTAALVIGQRIMIWGIGFAHIADERERIERGCQRLLHERQSDRKSHRQRSASEYGTTKPKIVFRPASLAVKHDGSNMNERRAERRLPIRGLRAPNEKRLTNMR
jgi:hypothetical protein